MKYVVSVILFFFAMAYMPTAGAEPVPVRLAPYLDMGLFVQEEDEEDKGALTEFYDRYLGEEEDEEPTEVGWFIGPMFLLLSIDSSPFDPMTSHRELDSFAEATFVWGPKGGFIRKRWRLGALYLNGEQGRRDRIGYQKRTAELWFYGAGLFGEYNREWKSERSKKYPARIPFTWEGYLIGLMVGGGRMEMEAKGHDLGPEAEWRVTETLTVVYPYIGLWSAPFRWFWMQIDVGYLYFHLDVDDKKYMNAGVRMVDKDFYGGVQFGLKFTFGDNPNI